MADKAFFTRECSFYIIPGNTFLFKMWLPYLPSEGMLVDYFDVDTSTTTRYRIQDVILEVDKVAATPSSPGPPVVDGTPETHVPGWCIEVSVLP